MISTAIAIPSINKQKYSRGPSEVTLLSFYLLSIFFWIKNLDTLHFDRSPLVSRSKANIVLCSKFMLTLQFTVEFKPCILKYYTTRHGPSAHEHCSTAALQDCRRACTMSPGQISRPGTGQGPPVSVVMKLGVWHDLTIYSHYRLTTSGHTFTGNIISSIKTSVYSLHQFINPK